MSCSVERELAAIVTQFDCSRTLETGLGRGGPALAIAAVHEQRGRGRHIALDPHPESVFSSEGLECLRRAGLLHRVQFIASSSEVALPELLCDGVEVDFALIPGPKRFEDAFVEFLYLDRMLVTGGIMALAGAEDCALAAVLEFVGQARAYELRSEAGSELAVLRKLGRQCMQETPFPSRWNRPGEHTGHDLNAPTENGVSATGATDLPYAAVANGSTLDASSSRELHLARARVGELEVRVAELGTRLIDTEQRAAELVLTRARLREVELELQQARDQLSQSEAAHERAERTLACVNSSASWRLTAPLRSVKRSVRGLVGR